MEKQIRFLKIGQYDVHQGKFGHRYIIHKIMKKTCDVSVLTNYQGSPYKGSRAHRYPKQLLEQQVEGAYFTSF